MLPKTLYLSRNGLLEPLGQSQVMAYLVGLSRKYEITLVTYEKDDDWLDADAMKRARAHCVANNIRWLPQRFYSWHRILAPLFSMVWMVWLVRREVKREGIELIHARSYIPATASLAVSWLTGVPFLFDMRALWPEELITAGRLRRRSFVHKLLLAAEKACLSHAAGVVSLTNVAVEHLKMVYPIELEDQIIVVIPTCADLDRFQPKEVVNKKGLVHGCIGTVLSGWFRVNWLATWLQLAASRDPEALFDIVTRDDPRKVREALDPDGRLKERLSIGSCIPADMPEAISKHDLSVMFFTEGLSKIGSSPTRMAEVLGMGLPVVANKGVGDVALILEKYRVGVFVDGPDADQMSAALLALDRLLLDPCLHVRCRLAAEEVFSLSSGTAAYSALYALVLSQD